MSNVTSLTKRLDRIEARRGGDTITGLLNLAGYPSEIAAEAVRDWRTWVADGRARRIGSTLVLRGPILTVEQWAARHAPHRGSLQ
jgi:hypothetical protein